MLHDIFISFNSKDIQEVEQINKYLSDGEDGLKCWHSEGNIGAGHNHNDIVPENIHQAGIFLLVLSANSWNSQYVQNEIAVAKNDNKLIIPVLIDKDFDKSKVLYRLGDAQFIKITDWSVESLDNLKLSLQKELDKIEGTPWYKDHEEEIEKIKSIADQTARDEERKRLEEERRKQAEINRAKRSAEFKVISKDLDKFRKSITEKVYGDIDETSEDAAEKRVNRTKNLLIAILAVVILLVGTIGYLKHRYYTIPINDYIEVSYSGFDGIGVAEYTFNVADFNDKYSKRIKAAKEEGVEAAELLSLSIELSQTEGLSNGDTIQLLIDSDRNQFKQDYGYNLKYKSSTKLTVEGLTEVETFDPFENLSVTYNGANGYGEAVFERVSDSGYLGEGRFVIGDTKGLSNGDTIKVEFDDGWGADPTDEFVRDFGKAPYPLEKEYTVSGLGEQESFDAFSYLTVEYEGLDGYGELILNVGDGFPEGLKFVPDVKSNLSNGDKIEISLTDNWGDNPTELCKSSLGIDPLELNKSYTVEGLGEYISSLEQLSEEEIQAIQTQASDYLTAYITNDWDDDEKAVDTTYEGAYLLKRKDGVNNGAKNSLAFVFCTSVQDYMESTDTTVDFYYYWYLKYDDVSVNAEGEYSMNLMDYDLANGTAINDVEIDGKKASWRYKGYSTIEELKTNLVTKNIEYYTYTTSVDEDALTTKDNEAIDAKNAQAEVEEETEE